MHAGFGQKHVSCGWVSQPKQDRAQRHPVERLLGRAGYRCACLTACAGGRSSPRLRRIEPASFRWPLDSRNPDKAAPVKGAVSF
jgi:TnpA family transposase